MKPNLNFKPFEKKIIKLNELLSDDFDLIVRVGRNGELIIKRIKVRR